MRKTLLPLIGAGLALPLGVVCGATNTYALSDTVTNLIHNDVSTIELDADVTEDIVIEGGKTVTIDLKGHDITAATCDAITVDLYGDLTIIDTVGTGTVKTAGGNQCAALYNNGTAHLKGGTFTRDAAAAASYYTILNHGGLRVYDGATISNADTASSLVDNGYYDFNHTDHKTGYVSTKAWQSPSMIVYGGTLEGGMNTIKNDDNAVLVVEGGTISNSNQVAIHNNSSAIISGGTFNVLAGDKTVVFNRELAGGYNAGELTIEGGTFNADYLVEGISGDTAGSVSIEGGDFTGITTGLVNDGAGTRPGTDAGHVVVEGGKFDLSAGGIRNDLDATLAAGSVLNSNGVVTPPSNPGSGSGAGAGTGAGAQEDETKKDSNNTKVSDAGVIAMLDSDTNAKRTVSIFAAIASVLTVAAANIVVFRSLQRKNVAEKEAQK